MCQSVSHSMSQRVSQPKILLYYFSEIISKYIKSFSSFENNIYIHFNNFVQVEEGLHFLFSGNPWQCHCDRIKHIQVYTWYFRIQVKIDRIQRLTRKAKIFEIFLLYYNVGYIRGIIMSLRVLFQPDPGIRFFGQAGFESWIWIW